MNLSKLRRNIAWEAARLMYQRQESEYYRAKMKAGRRICRGWVKPADLPSNAEIRDQIQRMAHLQEGDQGQLRLREMRIEALRLMRLLRSFRPRLIGSVLTGHVRQGSDIDIHVFCNSTEAVTTILEFEMMNYTVQRKRVRKHGQEQTFTHIHIKDRFPFELTLYPVDKTSYVFKSSITGKAMERASIAQLERLLESTYPNMDLEQEMLEAESKIDRFQVYEANLLPLELVKQDARYHPEGDALYHSLQVFDLACAELPYDEEFLLAALLHDVGKAIDPAAHVEAGLEALQGTITDRTAWLIAHHMDAHAIRDFTLGHRAKRRLREAESYDELILLAACDKAGRKQGVEVPDVDDALDYLRDLAQMCE